MRRRQSYHVTAAVTTGPQLTAAVPLRSAKTQEEDADNYALDNHLHQLGPRAGDGERQAITWLRNNDDIVIRQADKGGATVVWG
ncbi:hypothetical protein WMY93_029353 [Mugilogobius chulae]|uniref:Uncharacterized protein n=1 Tax=Mugilogobius chulae TaxID=88201 RepID=A0AAW0N1X6_9GOBI